ncbi:MAG: Na+/H+ antiporter NhaC family protein [Candidatus Krumholzibacteriota bacterium]|nr:Na+/H+ antiporter NhaC family protein [Candidatus Krumholzibacteriota bacterium]
MRLRNLLLPAIALVITSVAVPARSDSPAVLPPFVVEHVPFEIEVKADGLDAVPYALIIIGDDEIVYSQRGLIPTTIRNVRVPSSGNYELVFTTAGENWETPFRAVPGWLTLLPALVAILVALVFRQVHVALFAGVWLGAFIVKDYNPVAGFFYVIDHYVIDSIAGKSGWDHTSIALFTLLLGGLVGVVSANGGAAGIVRSISGFARGPRRGQMATWLMGLLIFFDDYTNTLIVGNTMRPVTDRLRISREKLAYIVDSTAAPVASIAVITSWIGFEISLIKDAFESVGMLDRNPFSTFVASVPYSFYPILTLVFVFFVARLGRDFGPMLAAERRARSGGGVLAPGAVPISNIDADLPSGENAPQRWFNAVVPIAVVIAGTIWGLIETGRASAGADASLFDALREGNSFVALLWSSFAGCVAAIVMTLAQRILSLRETMGAWVAGVKTMTPAMIILVLAWSIGAVCGDLHTADYLVSKLSGVIAPQLLPVLMFLVAAAVSFATGTSWGTMTILTPLCIPLVIRVTQLGDIAGDPQTTLLLSSIAAILSGAVFGDHCSPISDTTIMSSMASSSDHIDHVRTQLPYAVTVALLAVVLGYVPTALGLPGPLALLIGAVGVFAVVRVFGKPVADGVTS